MTGEQASRLPQARAMLGAQAFCLLRERVKRRSRRRGERIHLIFRVTFRHGQLPRSAGKRQAGCLRSQPVIAVIKQPKRATIPAPFIAAIGV